ncbi:MAG: topoisomerase C-terminal repeat-containing protein, partial [Peptostreptococcaceae bacterium]
NDVCESEKGYICSNYSTCKFGIWTNDRYLEYYNKKPNKTMVKSILKNGQAKVKSLTSKNGSKFDAILKYDKNDKGYWAWSMQIEPPSSN